jgi:ATP-binding cassette subfamily B protein
LAALPGRLVEPDSGQVLIDGVPVESMDEMDLRGAVAYAFERPALLGHTVIDAIGYGGAAPSPTWTARAAGLARADGFVRLLPDGYHTAMTELALSGGEVQRLGLARAIAQDASLLVLDDATSSLDTATEAEVTVAITGALVGHTRLVVAHRVSTAARADLVAWLDGGRLRAVAPHATLWRDPEYRAVFTAETDHTGNAGNAGDRR